ncbi:ATP phosphoribosyltransferase regulatory subunit [Microbacterium sp. EYE_5]|uniref:histidine--tRNA ligase n=1 Tax=unclassified Microbacterium TaxID=2609290 RepID=UPI00200371AF|nr:MULTISPECIES: ATP phosphoribosyltransferase regulatory subunit [unclassified Microbacterium]MCK6081118.1 ATP phosphoribosyltransferase regulatory subunit [Microbacterium sp. EYE_382]MCK6086388.1 ATP phosphoribosyltransferase regulatory subunit [Microbacterium sp. EYE_384]MCK6124114.1 ATP phosphoribosyltransferase regulatory subunit [Microbacterium sp. EYE_80]MCK6127023.1 ATP phosphoribosyltransferase regulatory subunit [Microbacterium sp. EYE_79]MCK6142073.1 ATP phosphoribosyltransferase re
MRDFLPADKARRERVLAVIRDRYRAHGFDEIETPVVEDYERLHAGIGGDNEKLAFNVLRRGLDADAIRDAADDPAALSDLGLRYDLTVPLARFYATNRGQLPSVFRAIQIAPVWRAERPQKGRYRQFVQCDIDIIGDATSRAEVELLVASLDVLDALGLEGGTIRINDRRALDAMLAVFGFAEADRAGVLITIDKLDKVGPAGVVAELRERGADKRAVEAFERYLTRPQTKEYLPFGEAHIRKALPDGIPDEVVADLAGIGDAVAAARATTDVPLRFDPFLVRGMGYYTGTIYELAHPSVPYSLGGGGRYDGMIGRFLGQDVPAAGFSIGFERLVDLVDAQTDAAASAVVLIADRDVSVAQLAGLKAALVARGARVRLEQRTKNLKGLLERSAADGYTSFATVTAETTADSLEPRPLS